MKLRRRCIVEKYRRVHWRNTWQRRDPRKRYNIWLDTFDANATQEYDMMAIEFCGIKAKANFPIPMDEINQIYIQINTTESSNVVVVAAIEVEVKAVMVESTSPLNLSLKCSSGGGGGDGDFVAIVGSEAQDPDYPQQFSPRQQQ
ncbi:hypothetical protein BC332_20666 [Capsicum chinense]|nr:hypothetical protein BC332_20666 [Capsicum chinense]